jgi:hypothetical protein
MLLPTPLKLGVIALTLVVELFRGVELENAVAIIIAFFGITSLLSAWWLAARRLRTTGLVLIGVAAVTPIMLGPPSHVPRSYPHFNRLDPPSFPSTGRVERNTIVALTDDGWFREKNSPHRIAILRGVNFGASVKIPSSADATHLKPADFYSKHRDVSFVSRPCPLAECDEHLARLASWGFNALRLLITWEAVEHKGPGIYDHEYLQYLKALCRKAAKHGISVFVDPHQDVWSRFTGGDGQFSHSPRCKRELTAGANRRSGLDPGKGGLQAG